MSLLKRRLVLAATATTLGIGGVLLPGASAMAATTPNLSTTATAAPSRNTMETAHSPSAQPNTWWCELDQYGNWVCVWK